MKVSERSSTPDALPARRILVFTEAGSVASALTFAVAALGCGSGVISVVVFWRPRRLVYSLAVSSGIDTRRLEDEEMQELQLGLQAIAAGLARTVAVSFRLSRKRSWRSVRRFVDDQECDLVIFPVLGLSYRRRILAHRLRRTVPLLLIVDQSHAGEPAPPESFARG
jgi:hypothetical protein